MDSDLAHKAVALALSGNWQEALTVNLAILKLNPQDVDALNRLARVYGELGKVEKARKYTQMVLKIDPVNSIAGKALNKWRDMKPGKTCCHSPSSAEAFLEDPGKTKIVPLLHLGSQEVLSALDSGDRIELDCHCHRVAVNTVDGKYIGRLPDDISARIKKLGALDNKYAALIKTVDSQAPMVKIFIRETFQGKKAAKIISFPGEKIEYASNSILPDELFS